MSNFNQRANDRAAHAAAIEASTLAPEANQVRTITATAHTAEAVDAGNLILFDNALPIGLTIPPNSAVPFPIDTEISFTQLGAGAVTVIAGAGVTVESRDDALSTAGQFSAAMAKKIAADTWLLIGDVA